MTQKQILRPRTKNKHLKRRIGAAFVPASVAVAGAGADFPMIFREPDRGRSTLATGGISAILHFGVIAVLFILTAMQPEIIEKIIPVQLLKEKPPEPPAPARRALAERRKLDFSPAMQAVQPQIVNRRVIAEAAPSIDAEVLQMDAVNTAAAPTQVSRAAIDVDRVSAVSTIKGYRASKVDANQLSGPVVRGPVRAEGPVGPSVGPRKVVGADASSIGTGELGISQGSSVRDGVLSSRDVVGSPTGAVLVSVDTTVGEGNLHGPGGTGSGLLPDGAARDCLERPEVKTYMDQVYTRVYSRWTLPHGIADVRVTLRFAIDVAGSASSIQLVNGDNALGASAIDAMRTASPFPPMPDRARCLASRNLLATFTSASTAG
jgi:hypothetical protein